MIRQILLPVGVGPMDEATEVALQIAHASRAAITCLGTVDTRALTLTAATAGFGMVYYDFESVEKRAEELRHRALHRMQAVIDQADEEQVTPVLLEGAPWDCIELESMAHDLVVVHRNAHFREGDQDEAGPGRTVQKLLDRCVAPLLCVTRAPLGGRTVLVAVDGRPPSARALHQFVQSGLLDTAKVLLLHCDEADDLVPPRLDSMLRYLKAHGRDAELFTQQGNARRLVPDVAEAQDVDLVVLGAHGRARVTEWLLGSTTQELLKDGDRALFIGH